MGKKGANRSKGKDGNERPNKPRGEAGRVINDDDISDAESNAASEVSHLTLDDDLASVIGDGTFDDGEEEIADLPDDRLEQFLENASHKNPAIRTTAVKSIQVLLTKHYMYEGLAKWKASLIELIEKNIKRSEVEGDLMSTLAALLSIQMGDELDTDLVQCLATMRQLCGDPAQPEALRSNCALALGICSYLSTENPKEIQDVFQVLYLAWSSVKATSSSSSLFSAALAAWSLLAGHSANIRGTIGEYSKIVSYLESPSLDMRVGAGEALGCLYEIAIENVDENYKFPNHEFIVQKLSDLATDSVKYRAKRDRRIQRFTFRQIHDFLRGGQAPSVSIKFGGEVLELQALQSKLLYDICCKFLHGGMNFHLKKNELIRDVFDLGAPVEEGEGSVKLSKQQRQLQQRDMERTRNMHRAKQRDKRSANYL